MHHTFSMMDEVTFVKWGPCNNI